MLGGGRWQQTLVYALGKGLSFEAFHLTGHPLPILAQPLPDPCLSFTIYILFDFDTSHRRLCEGRVSEPECDQRRPRPLFYVASTSQTLALVPAAWCHSYSAFNTFFNYNFHQLDIYLDRCVYIESGSANDNSPSWVTCINFLLFYCIYP